MLRMIRGGMSRATAAVVMTLGVVSAAGGQAVLYVDDDAPPEGDGLSWETAYRFLQDALVAAEPGSGVEEIRVAQGVYQPDRFEWAPDGLGDRDLSFKPAGDVVMAGGYAGYGAPDPDARDIELYETILSGDLLGDDGPEFENYGENSYHVVRSSGVEMSAGLSGLTIEAGYADQVGQAMGGGVYCLSGALVVNDCQIAWNMVAGDGGGAYLSGCEASFVDCRFEDNVAGDDGGGVLLKHFEGEITSCVFIGNEADAGGGCYTIAASAMIKGCDFTGNRAEEGGAVAHYGESAGPDFIGCTFDGNTADTGGALYTRGDVQMSFTDCTFVDNTAKGLAEGGGGAAHADCSGEFVFTNCAFAGNRSLLDDGAGLVIGFLADAAFTDCTFTDHATVIGVGGAITNQGQCNLLECLFTENGSSAGGAIHNHGEVVSTGCTFEANFAQQGGAIFSDAGKETLDQCTFTGNFAPEGGAMYSFKGSEWISESLFCGNFAEYGGAVMNDESFIAHATACTFSGNEAGEDGGAMRNVACEPYVLECEFSKNSAYHGGGVYNESPARFEGCNFAENEGQHGGAMYCAPGGDAHVSSSSFVSNNASVGGGIFTDECEPIVVTSTFDGNRAAQGGGVFCAGQRGKGDMILGGCTFAGNEAWSRGGALYSDASSPLVLNCSLLDNVAALYGGGAAMIGSTGSFDECLFMNNLAVTSGGGVHVDAWSTTSIVNCTFHGNAAGLDDPLFRSGGAVGSCFGEVMIEGSVFNENGAPAGGAIADRFSTTAISECVFDANLAAGTAFGEGGGAIHSVLGAQTLVNCLFTGNVAEFGGGIFSSESECSLVNCTWSGNTAGTWAGGAYFHYTPAALANCIAWGNSGGQIDGDFSTVTYSCIEGGWPGEGNIDADPLFVAPDEGDYRLAAGSPCIDAADNTAVPVDVTTDLDGNPRFVDDPATEDTGYGEPPIVDMGPYEFQPAECPADITGDGIVDVLDLTAILMAWGSVEGAAAEDVNGDGAVDVLDLLFVLDGWGVCG